MGTELPLVLADKAEQWQTNKLEKFEGPVNFSKNKRKEPSFFVEWNLFILNFLKRVN